MYLRENRMKQMKSKLDPFHLQIILNYLKTKQDFLNIIQVNKQYEYLLDRCRINPVPITNSTKNLFQYLDTQQIFEQGNTNDILDDIKILQFNYTLSYSETIKLKETYSFELKFKSIELNENDKEIYDDKVLENVKILGEKFFSGEKFQQFNIPTNITAIRESCFENCSSLQQITIPYSVIKLDSFCFDNCQSLTKIELSTNLLEIDYSIFFDCDSLKQVKLPPYLTRVDFFHFENCKIEEVVLPNTIQKIENFNFTNCISLTKLDFSQVSGISSLEASAFEGCSNLKIINMNDDIEIFEKDCFKKCTSLSSIKFPSSLFLINKGCFMDCSSLETLLIPLSVKIIEKDAFKNCNSLEKLIIRNEKCQIKDSIIDGCSSLTNICMPLFNGFCPYLPTRDESNTVISRFFGTSKS